MITAGKHRARALPNVEFGMSQNGTEQIAITFVLTSTGDKITWFGTFAEKAVEITLKGMANAGWTGPDPTNPAGLGTKECEIEIEDHEWQGKKSLRVKWINDPSAAPRASFAKPLEGAALQSLRARIMARGAQASTNGAVASMTAALEDAPF